VNETELNDVLGKLSNTTAYLKTMEDKLKTAPENEEPPVLPTDIQLRCDMAKGTARRLLFAPKRVAKTSAPKTSTEEEKTDPPKEDL
jgi:hypothetical protein